MSWKSFLPATLFCFMQLSASSQQTGKDSLKFYIKNLGWQSFSLTSTYVRSLIINDDAQSIIDNTTDTNKVVSLLMKEVDNKDKVVAVHVVLTSLFEPKNKSFKEGYIYSGDSIIATTYTYNSLTWKFENKTEAYDVKPEDIKRIKRYWRNKLKLSSDARRLKKKSSNDLLSFL